MPLPPFPTTVCQAILACAAMNVKIETIPTEDPGMVSFRLSHVSYGAKQIWLDLDTNDIALAKAITDARKELLY